MSWVCQNCSADNPDDTADRCFVCLAPRTIVPLVDDDYEDDSSDFKESEDEREYTPPRHVSRTAHHKVVPILLSIIFFIIGQIVQYSIYKNTARVWVVEKLFGPVPLLFVVITTFLSAICIATICFNSWHLADDRKYTAGWILGILSSFPFAIIPSFMGLIGIFLFPIIAMICAVKICSDYKEDDISKTFGIALPIVLYIVGQIVQYYLFLTAQTALFMDSILVDTPLTVVIISTVLNVATTIMTAINCYKMADDGEFCSCWLFGIGVGLLNVVAPCVFGYVGIIAIGIITYLKVNCDEEWIPTIGVIASFIIGQIFIYVPYVRTGDVFVLSNLIIKNEAYSFNVVAFLIVTTIFGFVASILMSYLGHKLMKEDKAVNANASIVPFSILMIICPTIISILGLVYAIILLIIKKKKWYMKLAIPLMILFILPAAVMIPVSGSAQSLSDSIKPKFTVVLDSQGGDVNNTKITVRLDSSMPVASRPKRVGYTFEGYYDNKVGGTQYYNENMKSAKKWDKEEDSTLYAHWKANEYRVTFDYNEGRAATI